MVGYFLSFLPIYKAWRAHAWTAMPCEVIASRLERGEDTFRADIQYRYSVGDRAYIASRYNFLPGSNSDSSIPGAVDRYAAGTTFECYVDPDDPTEAVINRDLTPWYFMGVLFFVFFTILPGGIGLVVLRGARKARVDTAAAPHARTSAGPSSGVDQRASFGADERAIETGPVVLKPAMSPMGKLIGAIVIALFWNGIVGIFTYLEIQQFRAGGFEFGCLAVFLLIFQVIGLALLVNVPYQFLALANPRPTITLSSRSAPVGGAISLEWQLSGAAHRVKALRLTLQGREEARYRRGTDTRTDTHVFYKETVIETTDSMSMPRGTATVRVPSDTMHTFEAGNNKVLWTLQLKGSINRWPDVEETFDITVRPR